MSSLHAIAQPFALAIEDLAREVRLRHFTGEEAISKLFRFRLVADITPRASAAELLGRNAVFSIALGEHQQRTFVAMISAVEELGSDEHGCATYDLELVPRLWPLVHTVRARVFEDMDALSIIMDVFTGSGTEVVPDATVVPDASSIGRPRPYCVQYFESDFDFVARLLEEEGWVYQCGRNDKNQPTFEIKPVPSNCPVVGSLRFDDGRGGHHERIGSWRTIRNVGTTTLTGHDHLFQVHPPVLAGVADLADSSASIPGWEPLDAGWAASVDRFPSQCAHLFEEISRRNFASAPSGYKELCYDRAWLELRQAVGSSSMNAGAGNSARLAPGTVFELTNHPNSNGKHLVVSVRHKGAQALQHSTGRADGFEYENQFTCVPFAAEQMMYLPPRATRKPVIHGCQTAVVVGSSESDEIWTDMYGRVQVRFWWDRENARSCWVRVATSWAGKNWGVQHVPRVGQEVVVTFLDGDPDRPLIVGSVYNTSNMPPFSLPEHKTQSGIRTHSTTQGAHGASNEIRFEDAKGSEEIYIHAERDRTEEVAHDARQKIGNDSRNQVKGNRFDLVAGNLHAKTGGERREAVVGDSSLIVGGDYTIAVGNKYKPGVGGHVAIAAMDKIHLKASSIVIEADDISIRTTESGREFIRLAKGSGITIDSKGDHVWLNTGGADSPADGCFKQPVAQPEEPFPPAPNPKPHVPIHPLPNPGPKPLPYNPLDLKKR